MNLWADPTFQLVAVGVAGFLVREAFSRMNRAADRVPVMNAQLDALRVRIELIDAKLVALDPLAPKVASLETGHAAQVNALAETRTAIGDAMQSLTKVGEFVRDRIGDVIEALARTDERWHSVSNQLADHDARTRETADRIGRIEGALNAAPVRNRNAAPSTRKAATRAKPPAKGATRATAKRSPGKAASGGRGR